MENYKLRFEDFDPGIGWARYILRNTGNENAPEVDKRDKFLAYYQIVAIATITFIVGNGLDKLLSH